MTARATALKAPSVQGLRRHLKKHRWLAALLVIFALSLKMVVPTGFMLDTSGGTISVVMCSGTGPMKMMSMAEPGMAKPDMNKSQKDGHKSEQPCAFSGLSAPSLAAADPILLALAISFIIATVFRRAHQQLIGAPSFLRPPLRGPPAIS